jgi:hypothetical protein
MDKTSEFIEKSKSIHGDKYDYSNAVYVNSTTKIILICKKHGEFEQNAKNHLKGKGCSKCAGKNMTTLDFIEKVKDMHGNMYDYSKTIYINAKTNITIICKTHGGFELTPNKHLQKRGCQLCSRIHQYDDKRDSLEDFIAKSKETHGNKYDYRNTRYVNSTTKVNIVCKEHGEFLQMPSVHKNGMGCQKCGKNHIPSNYEFIEKSKEMHGDNYEYPNILYLNNSTPVNIVCKIHGTFKQRPDCHLRGGGCFQCRNKTIQLQKRKTIDVFMQESDEVHGDTYDYSKVEYIDSDSKIIIICKKHGEFLQCPRHHLRGGGCIKCNPMSYSKSQIKWLTFINPSIQHAENGGEYCIPKTKYKADGYFKETNTIYEFHGDYWHGNPTIYDKDKMNMVSKKTFGELYQRTLEKEEIIRKLGYNLVTMWENDWNKINNSIKILQKKIRIKYSHSKYLK